MIVVIRRGGSREESFLFIDWDGKVFAKVLMRHQSTKKSKYFLFFVFFYWIRSKIAEHGNNFIVVVEFFHNIVYD